MARVVSVFVGRSQPFPGAGDGPPGRSGIYKRPVTGPVPVDDRGLAGDENAERPAEDADQAACAYPVEHYAWWADRFPERRGEFVPGVFGENFSIEGIDEDGACVGDVYEVGHAAFVVSKPRGPCRKIGQRLGIGDLASVMRRSLRTGWYMGVVRTGTVEGSAPFMLVERPSPGITVRLVAEAMYLRPADHELASRVLGAEGLAENWKAVFAARVAGRAEPVL